MRAQSLPVTARPSAASSLRQQLPRRAPHRLPARRYPHKSGLRHPRRSLPKAPPARRAARHIAQPPRQKHDPPHDPKAARHKRHLGAAAAIRARLRDHRSCQSRHRPRGKRHKAQQQAQRCVVAAGRMRRESFSNHPPIACCKPQDLQPKYRSVQTCASSQFSCFSHFRPSGGGSAARQAPLPRRPPEWRSRSRFLRGRSRPK